MPFTPQQKLTIFRELESRVGMSLTMALKFFDDQLNQAMEEGKNEFASLIESHRKEFVVAVEKMAKEAKKIQVTVKDGRTPVKGRDYFDGKTPTDDELIVLIKNVMPEPKNGTMPTTDEIRKAVAPIIPEPVEMEGDDLSEDDVVALIKKHSPIQDAKNVDLEEIVRALEPLIDSKISRRMKGTKGKYHAAHGGGDSMSGIIRVTTTQRIALTGLLGGEIVYDTTLSAPYLYAAGQWYAIQLAS